MEGPKAALEPQVVFLSVVPRVRKGTVRTTHAPFLRPDAPYFLCWRVAAVAPRSASPRHMRLTRGNTGGLRNLGHGRTRGLLHMRYIMSNTYIGAFGNIRIVHNLDIGVI